MGGSQRLLIFSNLRSAHAQDAMIKAKVVRPLVRLLSAGDETGQKRAAEVLRALATDHENKDRALSVRCAIFSTEEGVHGQSGQ